MKETGAVHNEAPTFEVHDTRQPLTDEYEVLVHEPIK